MCLTLLVLSEDRSTTHVVVVLCPEKRVRGLRNVLVTAGSVDQRARDLVSKHGLMKQIYPFFHSHATSSLPIHLYIVGAKVQRDQGLEDKRIAGISVGEET
jgi:hypothetical protein